MLIFTNKPMKYIHYILAALALLVAPGWQCQTLNQDPEAPTFTDMAFNLGVKFATYKTLQQNPEFIDLANAIADVLEGKGSDVVQGSILVYIKDSLIPKYIENGADQILATEAVDSFYLLFKPTIDELSAKAKLPVLAQNIRAGITYATLNPDAAR